ICSCLHYFHFNERLQSHIVDCRWINDCVIRLSSDDDNLENKSYNRKERIPFVVYADLKCILEKTDSDRKHLSRTYQCYVQTPEKWVFREREKGVEKDGAWKDGQTLVSQVFAWKQTPASRTHLFFVRFGIWVNVS
ncbi:hypothetical protein ALC56_08306, partial [Trachymyrmex septentrionalis]